MFGIFGSVGSGKSSILEGITFALYGETERLNAKEKRAYNMMNLKSDRAYICFDFVNYNDITYRIEREFKRNSKRFDDIKSPTVVLYQKINEKWVPQNNHNIQDIVGLSYDNFKRTIIIPQGKFKEFIELKPTERTQMLKEIFKLHQYDLFDKVTILNSENSKALNQSHKSASLPDEKMSLRTSAAVFMFVENISAPLKRLLCEKPILISEPRLELC